jgi:hypothetical protein
VPAALHEMTTRPYPHRYGAQRRRDR